MRSLDTFSCIGCHALGFARAGIETVAFCEINPARRAIIACHFPKVPIHDDVRTIAGFVSAARGMPWNITASLFAVVLVVAGLELVFEDTAR